MTKFYVVLGVVALIGVGAVGYSTFTGVTSAAATAPVELEGLDDPQRLIEMAQGVGAGNPEAAVQIWEFADYQCPACSQFAGQVKPQIDMAYVETGQVQYKFFDFPLAMHPHAFLAARAARCAGDQDRYWDYHDTLFQNQNSWAFGNGPAGAFVDYAGELGLDRRAFEACLNSDAHAEVVTANMRLGEELRVSGTPTLIVIKDGGMPVRAANFSWPAVQEAVQAALAQ